MCVGGGGGLVGRPRFNSPNAEETPAPFLFSSSHWNNAACRECAKALGGKQGVGEGGGGAV